MSRRDVDREVAPLAMGTSDDPTQFDSMTEDGEEEDENDVDEEKGKGGEELKYCDKRMSFRIP